MKHRLPLMALLFAACVLAACQRPADHTGEQAHREHGHARFKVVATFSILEDLARPVVGEHATLISLVPRGADPHTFDPTPGQMKELAQADLVVMMGLDFEPWMADLLETSGTRARVVRAGEEFDLLQHGGETDPHLWLDVLGAVHLTERITRGASSLDDHHAPEFENNGAAAVGALRALHQWVVTETAKVPPAHRVLFTHHDTFQYFARRYGFTVRDTLLASLNTETEEPSAAHLARIVTEIRASGVPAIFAETTLDPELARRVAREAGVALAPPLFTGSLDQPGAPAGTYEGMIRHDVTTIVTALGVSP